MSLTQDALWCRVNSAYQGVGGGAGLFEEHLP